MSKTNGNRKALKLVLMSLFCIGAGIIAMIASLALFSWIFVKQHLSFWTAIPLATVAGCIGCFFCGLVLARKIKINGLFCGFCSGILFFGVYLIIALLNGISGITTIAAIKFVSFVFAGCLGGYIGVLRGTKPVSGQKRF